eukprot:Rmarinus@m.16823
MVAEDVKAYVASRGFIGATSQQVFDRRICHAPKQVLSLKEWKAEKKKGNDVDQRKDRWAPKTAGPRAVDIKKKSKATEKPVLKLSENWEVSQLPYKISESNFTSTQNKEMEERILKRVAEIKESIETQLESKRAELVHRGVFREDHNHARLQSQFRVELRRRLKLGDIRRSIVNEMNKEMKNNNFMGALESKLNTILQALDQADSKKPAPTAHAHAHALPHTHTHAGAATAAPAPLPEAAVKPAPGPASVRRMKGPDPKLLNRNTRKVHRLHAAVMAAQERDVEARPVSKEMPKETQRVVPDGPWDKLPSWAQVNDGDMAMSRFDETQKLNESDFLAPLDGGGGQEGDKQGASHQTPPPGWELGQRVPSRMSGNTPENGTRAIVFGDQVSMFARNVWQRPHDSDLQRRHEISLVEGARRFGQTPDESTPDDYEWFDRVFELVEGFHSVSGPHRSVLSRHPGASTTPFATTAGSSTSLAAEGPWDPLNPPPAPIGHPRTSYMQADSARSSVAGTPPVEDQRFRYLQGDIAKRGSTNILSDYTPWRTRAETKPKPPPPTITSSDGQLTLRVAKSAITPRTTVAVPTGPPLDVVAVSGDVAPGGDDSGLEKERVLNDSAGDAGDERDEERDPLFDRDTEWLIGAGRKVAKEVGAMFTELLAEEAAMATGEYIPGIKLPAAPAVGEMNVPVESDALSRLPPSAEGRRPGAIAVPRAKKGKVVPPRATTPGAEGKFPVPPSDHSLRKKMMSLGVSESDTDASVWAENPSTGPGTPPSPAPTGGPANNAGVLSKGLPGVSSAAASGSPLFDPQFGVIPRDARPVPLPDSIQLRVEKVWADLHFPLQQKLDWAVKYTTRTYSPSVGRAMSMWEAATQAILARERAFRLFRKFEVSVRGGADRDEQRRELQATLQSEEHKCRARLAELRDGFGDIATYHGAPYEDKIRLDAETFLNLLETERQGAASREHQHS